MSHCLWPEFKIFQFFLMSLATSLEAVLYVVTQVIGCSCSSLAVVSRRASLFWFLALFLVLEMMAGG